MSILTRPMVSCCGCPSLKRRDGRWALCLRDHLALDRDDGYLRNVICRAVCEWCGRDDVTIRWRVTA